MRDNAVFNRAAFSQALSILVLEFNLISFLILIFKLIMCVACVGRSYNAMHAKQQQCPFQTFAFKERKEVRTSEILGLNSEL